MNGLVIDYLVHEQPLMPMDELVDHLERLIGAYRSRAGRSGARWWEPQALTGARRRSVTGIPGDFALPKRSQVLTVVRNYLLPTCSQAEPVSTRMRMAVPENKTTGGVTPDTAR